MPVVNPSFDFDPIFRAVTNLLHHLGNQPQHEEGEPEVVETERNWRMDAVIGLLWGALHLPLSSEAGASILEAMRQIHCMDLASNPPFIPLIVWEANRSTGCVFPGELKLPKNFTRESMIWSYDSLSLKHATHAQALVQMLQPDGLHLVGRRHTHRVKKADISTHGLVYCGVDTDAHGRFLSHNEARSARYGAAVIKFDLNPRGRHFYTLGSKFYMQECSQQILCTSMEADWKVLYVKDQRGAQQDAVPLPHILDLHQTTWPLGISRGTGWRGSDRWIHPEMVLEGDYIIPYDSLKISFSTQHMCIQTNDGRHQGCEECWQRCGEGLRRTFRWVDRDQLDKTNSASICLDLFAMEMVENPQKWEMIREIELKYYIFDVASAPGWRNGFISHIERRMSHFQQSFVI